MKVEITQIANTCEKCDFRSEGHGSEEIVLGTCAINIDR